MSIFSSALKLTLTWKLVYMIKSAISYIKDYNIVGKILYSDDFKMILKKYLNVDVKEDWIGRLYGIVNPLIDFDGNFNVDNAVIEIDGDNTNNNDQVQYWVFKQLRMIGELFKLKNIYGYISMDLEHVGPAIGDNYLLVFDIASRKNFAHSIRNFLLQLSIYIIVVLVAFLVI